VKRKRFSAEQIVAVLKQAEVGVPVVEVCRQARITEQTSYRWKKRFVGLKINHVRQLKQLQEENGKLKKLVAELPGQGHAPGRASKKILKPSRRRPVVHYLCGAYRVSRRRACRTAQIAESTLRYRNASRGPLFACGFGRSPRCVWDMGTQDPGAAEARGLECGQEAGVSAISGRRPAAPQAAAAEMRGDESEGPSEADSAE
jgi:putative transposase